MPPGTGVMYPATVLTASKLTSPTRRDFPASSVILLMPTSITMASGLTISAVIRSLRPAAATRISASRVISPKFWLREWAIVTVASAASNINASGLPTKILRPTTTAFLPRSGS